MALFSPGPARPRRIGALAPLVLAAAAALITLPLAAQTQWKWRDANGRIQYSDRPPPLSVPDQAILSRPSGSSTGAAPAPAAATASAASAPGASASAIDPALAEKRRQAEAAEAAKRKADEERLARQRQDNCQRARDYLRTLESGIRISRSNAQGEREYLDDAQRQREAARAREVIGSDCR
jgi:hypothetical protein